MSNQERDPYVLDFPNGQKVEDILKKADALPTKAQLDTDLAAKASKTEVQTVQSTVESELQLATRNLQAQIDAIEIGASEESVVAPEVIAARVDADGVTHATLKARCDSDAGKTTQLKEDLVDLDSRLSESIAKVVPYEVYDGSGDVTGCCDVKTKHGKIYGPVTNPYVVFGSKNLFDENELVRTGISLVDGYYTGTASAFNTAFNKNGSHIFDNTVDGQLTISAVLRTDANVGSAGAGLIFVWNYTDGTHANAFGTLNTDTDDTVYHSTSAAGKTVANISITYAESGGNVWYVKNVQIERGANATDYVRYNQHRSEFIQTLDQGEYIDADTVPPGMPDAFIGDFIVITNAPRVTFEYPVSVEYYVAKNGVDEKQRNAIDNSMLFGVYANRVVKSIAHRGYESEAPENTIPAFEMAKEKGFDYVETDVQFTFDGVPVLLHNTTIDATSNGTGAIRSITLAQARQYDFGSWKSPKYVGTKIPTFEEYLKCCRDLGLHPYIELQSAGNYTDAEIAMLCHLVKRYGLVNNSTWVSVSTIYLEKVLANIPNARVGVIVTDLSDAKIQTAVAIRSENNSVFMTASISSINESAIDRCIAVDMPLEAWTAYNAQTIINIDPYVIGITSSGALPAVEIVRHSILLDSPLGN